MTLKDADYYRLKADAITSEMKKNLNELKTEATASRFVISSLKEISARLGLEYSPEGFLADPQHHYASINAFLENHGLKLIPCFVPADLAFTDQIFVTLKPNLKNDEDCAAVDLLVKQNRKPTHADMIHISNMNIKLTNYNIMLRVFEGLFVVSQIRLDPHQRSVLNQLILKLAIPKEGMSYIRNCYTYACEFRNRHCDYKRKEYCFKPLDDKDENRVIEYLAMVAASSSYKENFHPDYPHYTELNDKYLELTLMRRQQAEKNNIYKIEQLSLPHSSKNQNSQLQIDRRFFVLGYAANNQLLTGGTYLQDKDLNVIVHRDSVLRENPLCRSIYEQIGTHTPQSLIIILQKFNSLCLLNYEKVLSTHRIAPYLVTTDNMALCNLIPAICPLRESASLMSEKTESPYYCYLLDQSKTDHYQEEANITETSEELILLHTFLLRFISYAFVPFSKTLPLELTNSKQPLLVAKDSPENMIGELKAEFSQNQYRSLLYIRALYFVLFECQKSPLNIDSMTYLALYYHPELSEIALHYLCYTRNIENIEDLYAHEPNIVLLFLFLGIASELKLDARGFHDEIIVSCDMIYAMLNELQNFVEKHPLEDYLVIKKTPCSLQDLDNLYKGAVYERVDLKVKSHVRTHERRKNPILQTLFDNALYICLIKPLVKKELLEKFTGISFEFHHELFKHEFNQSFYSKNLMRAMGSGADVGLARALFHQKLSKHDEASLYHNLCFLEFQNYQELLPYFKISTNNTLYYCLEDILLKLKLFKLPLFGSLPGDLNSHFTLQKIMPITISTDEYRHLEKTLLPTLELTLIIYSALNEVTANTIANLMLIVNKIEQQKKSTNDFLQNTLMSLRSLLSHLRKTSLSYYSFFLKHESFGKTRDYLNALYQLDTKDHPLKNYLDERYDELVNPKSSNRDRHGLPPHALEKERKPHVNHTVDIRNLNTKLIHAKIEETKRLQNVIEQIRIEEGNLSTADEEILPQKSAKNSMEQQTLAKKVETGLFSLLSPSCQRLLKGISEQHTEVIDLDEFNGLCLSSRFMSKDVAIEELNDFCYEHFDEPLFDLAPEENSIYITTEILSEILQDN